MKFFLKIIRIFSSVNFLLWCYFFTPRQVVNRHCVLKGARKKTLWQLWIEWNKIKLDRIKYSQRETTSLELFTSLEEKTSSCAVLQFEFEFKFSSQVTTLHVNKKKRETSKTNFKSWLCKSCVWMFIRNEPALGETLLLLLEWWDIAQKIFKRFQGFLFLFCENVVENVNRNGGW